MARSLGAVVNKKFDLDNNWDPTRPDHAITAMSPATVYRIMIDSLECLEADAHEIFVVPDSENILIANAVIVGPKNTPYEGGFFYFYIKFPTNYPFSPPRVKLMNTEQSSVRFNPNIYRNGMICLPILGTHAGDGWSPCKTLLSVLRSIRSLMNADPFHNAPGVTGLKQDVQDAPQKYNHYIRHETIRVAVINFMNEDNLDLVRMPTIMRDIFKRIFRQKIPFYCKTMTDNMFLDDMEMFDPFNSSVSGQLFDYNFLGTKMAELREKYETDSEKPSECSDLSDLSEASD